MIETATFALGCFWEPQHIFSKLKGVKSTRVGYIGGTRKNPTYDDVCFQNTGEAEAVEIKFDPKVISYSKLLEHFWMQHDPSVEHKTQYMSAIFYHNDGQKKLGAGSIRSEEKKLGKIYTKLEKAEKFYVAEEFHQNYVERHCAAQIMSNIRRIF